MKNTLNIDTRYPFVYHSYMKAIAEIGDIEEMLHKLPNKRVKEVRVFIGYLLEKEKKRKAFGERVLSARKEPSIEFESAEEIMKAIRKFKK